jgi:hypothetical protein
MWLSLVEHLVRDQGVAGSNPVIPTMNSKGLRIPDPQPFFRFRVLEGTALIFPEISARKCRNTP